MSDVKPTGFLNISEKQSLLTFHTPQFTWQAQILDSVVYKVEKPPNRFHRFMQRLCFGIVWSKL